MANVPHSGLTGADLHESKGVAAATANTIFVADGAGSGSFQTLPAAAISGLANPFGASLFHIQETQAAGVSTTNSTTINSFVNHVFNTVKTNEIAGASLVANAILLPAGTYWVDAAMSYFQATFSGSVCKTMAVLFNNTTGTTLATSRGIYMSYAGANALSYQGEVTLQGRFTLAAPSTLNVQMYKNIANRAQAMGLVTEVYSDCKIWKVA